MSDRLNNSINRFQQTFHPLTTGKALFFFRQILRQAKAESPSRLSVLALFPVRLMPKMRVVCVGEADENKPTETSQMNRCAAATVIAAGQLRQWQPDACATVGFSQSLAHSSCVCVCVCVCVCSVTNHRPKIQIVFHHFLSRK